MCFLLVEFQHSGFLQRALNDCQIVTISPKVQIEHLDRSRRTGQQFVQRFPRDSAALGQGAKTNAIRRRGHCGQLGGPPDLIVGHPPGNFVIRFALVTERDINRARRQLWMLLHQPCIQPILP